MSELLPCPFCGQTPDINGLHTFQSSQGTKWGSVVCCCTGPEVRTGYGHVDEWRQDAIDAWNTRAARPDREGWQPIETAPKDGTFFLATGGGLGHEMEVTSYNDLIGVWDAGQWSLNDCDDELLGYSRPKFWQPLPQPPNCEQ